MKKEFDIKYRPQIESGEYKVVTDCGEPVEVVKWNCKGECPILAVIDDGDVEDTCFFNEAGISPHGTDSLYIITDDIELTEFEKELGKAIYTVFVSEELSKTEISSLKDNAKKLLDIARKEVLKDMPKWKDNWLGHTKKPCITDEIPGHNGKQLCVAGKCISIDDLWTKLYKEE